MQAIPSGNDYFLTEIAADWAGQPWQQISKAFFESDNYLIICTVSSWDMN